MSWATQTPAFFPCFRKYKQNMVPFSMVSILRREYSGVLATVIGFAFVDDLRRYFNSGGFEWQTPWHIALLITIVIALTLRSLKHHTRLLDEADRS
jgi:hypothetical protein